MTSENTHGIGGLQISQDEVGISAFDLFAPVEIDNSIQKTTLLSIRPISASTDTGGGPYDFVVVADPEKWTGISFFLLSNFNVNLNN